MGFFFSYSSFDEEVEAATDGQKEDWQKIIEICDKAGASSQAAKECVTSIIGRLRHQDPHVNLQAITLLNACVNNSGKNFHLMIASREFETEYRKLLSKSKGEVRSKLLSMLRSWAEGEFSKDHQLSLIPSLCSKLRQEGYSFPSEGQKSEKPASVPRENTDDADLAKAIELSLKESSSPKTKTGPSGTSLYPNTSTALYPSTSLGNTGSPEGLKVLALYDFEDAEDGELTFKAGEIITVIDKADQNWWKGHSKRGEGLFPSNFVTTDLSVETETKKTVQFDKEVRVEKFVKEEAEINEEKMDMLLHFLHEADPTDPNKDPPEMRDLADEVNAMGPLIDAELERVDGKHAQLSQLCMDLQGALNLYHSLMREPGQPGPGPGPSSLSKPMGYHYQSLPPQSQINGAGPSMMHSPYNVMPGNLPHPGHQPPMGVVNGPLPPHFIPGAPPVRHPNGVPQYGTAPPGVAPQPGVYLMAPMTSMAGPTPPQPSYHDKPPLL